MNHKSADSKSVLPAFDRVAATTAAFYRLPLLSQLPTLDRTATPLDKHLVCVGLAAAGRETQLATPAEAGLRVRRRTNCALFERRATLVNGDDVLLNS